MDEVDVISRMYCNAYGDYPFDMTRNAFSVIRNRLRRVQDMAVIYIKISDETYNKIVLDKKITEDVNFIRDCYLEDGDNIYLLKAFGKGYKNFRNILMNLQKEFNPKTISWHRDGKNRLHKVK